jgi:hypothetical protein
MPARGVALGSEIEEAVRQGNEIVPLLGSDECTYCQDETAAAVKPSGLEGSRTLS